MSYSAPLGIVSRPFQSGAPYGPAASFPGAPPFATPTGNTALNVPFPVGGVGAPGANGIRTFAPGGSAPAVYSANRVADWPTNAQVAYHYVVMPDLNDDLGGQRLSSLGLGMMCFARDPQLRVHKIRRDEPAPAAMVGAIPLKLPKLPNYGTAPGERSVEVFEVTTLNKYLTVPENSAMYDTADQLLQDFRLMGVILNEARPTP